MVDSIIIVGVDEWRDFGSERAAGWSAQFWQQWSGGWMLSWLIAFPTVMIVLPVVRYLAGLVVDFSTPHPPRKD